jgi:hypothetical protein
MAEEKTVALLLPAWSCDTWVWALVAMDWWDCVVRSRVRALVGLEAFKMVKIVIKVVYCWLEGGMR